MDGEESGSQSLPALILNDISLSQLSMPIFHSQEGSLSLNLLNLQTSQENGLKRYTE